MLGQPISMLIPEVIGFTLTGKLREGVTATDLVLTVTADAAQEGRGRQVRRVLRPRPRPPVARRPRHHRQHGAGIRRHLRLLPGRRARRSRYLDAHRPRPASASRWSRPTPRRRACGATPTRPTRSSPTRSSSTSATVEPSLAGPKRPQDRVLARPRPRPSFLAALGHASSRRPATAAKRVAVAGSDYRPRPRRRGDRRDHLLHQHLQPLRDDRRRPARPQGASSAGPDAEALGEDLARPRLPGGHRLSRDAPACRTTSTRSASTSSAIGCTTCIGNSGPLPEPISAAIDDGDLVAAAVLSGNRNFEGRVNPRRARQLPRLAAAGRRLRARRLDAGRPRPPSRSAPARTASRSILKDIWPTAAGDRRVRPRQRHPRPVPHEVRRRLQGRRALADDRGRGRPDLSPGTPARPTCRTRPTSRACSASPSRSPTSPAPASSASSATRSPPTTSRRPARSRQTSPAGALPARPPGRARPTSTRTARGAATTR